MKIAVIGSGVAGLGAAYALSEQHDVRLFEKDTRFGGHANTAVVEADGCEIAVDTGFIVYNTVNYPNLTALFDHLGVPTKGSDMSFGFSLARGKMEYACDSLAKIFAQPLNVFRPSFWRAFRDVMRFIRIAPQQLEAGTVGDVSLGEWLDREGFGRLFRECFLLPMSGAIWSTPSERMMAFPAKNLLEFFANHDLYTGLKAAFPWRTVDGGSKLYVEELLRRLGPRAEAGRGVASVRRVGPRVELTFEDGRSEMFDQAVFACHGPQACAMLADKDEEEAEILSTFRTTQNTAVLHRDPGLMPKRKSVWSSWSMICDGEMGEEGRPVSLSYWMNRLQGLEGPDLFVTLNAERRPREVLTFARYSYDHPFFDQATFEAQTRLDDIQGRGGVWYAGAWTGWGFHEDGLKSGLRVAEALGSRPNWAAETGEPLAPPAVSIAAE
ncbi:MAG: FAD-dependent oxidoreductase [Pseudomonadota bacterium]